MADNELEGEVEGDGKSGRMALIIGILAGLTVGATGAFFWLNSDDEEEVTPEEEVVVEEVAPEEDSVSYVYLYIERMPASLIDENGRTVGYVFLDLTFELTDGTEQSFVSQRMPRVKDAILRAISEHGLTKPGTRGQIDYDRVSEYLLVAANGAVGHDYISGVYITRALRAPS